MIIIYASFNLENEQVLIFGSLLLFLHLSANISYINCYFVLLLDCKNFIETFHEIADSLKKEENEEVTAAAELLVKLSVDLKSDAEKKDEEKKDEEKPEDKTKEPESAPEKEKGDSEKEVKESGSSD